MQRAGFDERRPLGGLLCGVRLHAGADVDAGPGERIQQGLQLRAYHSGEPEFPGPGTIFGGPQMQVSAIRVELVFGQGAVRVDHIHHPIRQLFQIFRPETSRVSNEQLFPGSDVGR